MSAPEVRVCSWLIEPLPPDVAAAIERLGRAPDVRRIAIMPDVHMANDVCVGTVLGTSELLYPQAVGGDIGCGMLAVAFDVPSDALSDPTRAGQVLAELRQAIPILRHHRSATIPLPDELRDRPLSEPALHAVCRREGVLQFGTLGSGNHFVELQADEENRLWVIIHSGSRAMGQAIRDLHQGRAAPVGLALRALDAATDHGRAYLNDVAWGRAYADANRRAMADRVATVLRDVLGAKRDETTLIAVDHNHVVLEQHASAPMWIHRKGAMPAADGAAGVLPGSMGTMSFHVAGRGCDDALHSSAHGAGRAMSRESARRRLSRRDVQHQLQNVWYDFRQIDALREEAPRAYKDIRAVLRAQHELVRVTRTLRPVLNYKGG